MMVLLLTMGVVRQLVVGEYKCNAHGTRAEIDAPFDNRTSLRITHPVWWVRV
jgi:hypothetical protein